MTDPVTGTKVWLFDALETLVSQTPGPLTLAVARFYSGPVDAEVRRRFVAAGKKVAFFHDWRKTTTYDVEARDELLRWARSSLPHTRQVGIQIAKDASVFIRIAATTAVSALRLARVPISQIEDIDALAAQLAGR
ncbi:MAG: hypothetical protein ACOZQL_34185 [Myxococcota bacterium]